MTVGMVADEDDELITSERRNNGMHQFGGQRNHSSFIDSAANISAIEKPRN